MATSNLTVFTSIVGGYDALIDDQNFGNANWIAFTDKESKVWDIRKPFNRFSDSRRNSRVPKILASHFIDTEYSLWIDGNLKLLNPPEYYLKYLKDYDWAVYKHPSRDCAYVEAETCKNMKIEDPQILDEQVAAYRKEFFPEHRGLTENNVIIRRHTPKTRALEAEWWADYCRFSKRDQVSFMPCVERIGARINVIPENWTFETGTPTRDGIAFANHLKPRK